MRTKDLITEANSLPIDEKVILVDSLLKSFNNPVSGVDQEWTRLAKKRLSDLYSKKIKFIPGDLVFSRIQKKFSK